MNKLNDEAMETVNGGGGIFDPALHSIADAIDWSVFDPAINAVKGAAERAYDKDEPVMDKVYGCTPKRSTAQQKNALCSYRFLRRLP